MGRVFKFIFGVAALGFAGLVGYAYLGDISPQKTKVSVPVSAHEG